MSIDVEQRAGTGEPSRPEPAPKRGVEEHAALVVAGTLVIAVLVFVAMVVLTVLAGGDGYPN
ncbi:hypothetical protein [Modestobacter marinus]|nr:hypothetical protein [Modestobacter marinus]NIH65674.1 hypothetical protein [Modestobacter marinus]